MQIPLRVRLRAVSPVHIGCDDVYEPTSFVIDENRKVLLEFDPMHFVRVLNPAQRTELLRLCSGEDLLAIFKFVKRTYDPATTTPLRETAMATRLVDHYRRVMDLSTYNYNIIINQFTMNKTAYSPQTNEPYIPGTSVKGALRTAYLSYLAGSKGVKGARGGKGEAKKLEETLLGGTFDTDPFRMVKVSDFQPVENVKTRIMYGVNRKKTKSDKASKAESGPPQIFEVLEPGAIFEGTIGIENPAKGIEHPVTKEVLFEAINQHYLKVLKQDSHDRQEAGLRPFSVDGLSRGGSGTALLVRIGRHSGAEAVTIEGNRDIKIMQGRGKSLSLQRTTTFWLAAESSRPSPDEPLAPFGWAVLDIEPLDLSRGVYSERLTGRTRPWPKKSPSPPVESARVESYTKPHAPIPIQTEHAGVTIIWNPGNRTLTATVDGKKALADNVEPAFIPESLWPRLQKKKSVVATILVVPMGNAFRIMAVKE